MTDPFAAYAQERGHKPRPQRAPVGKGPKVVQSDADAPMKPSAMEQAQRDKSAQFSQYRKAKRAARGELLEVMGGAAYHKLLALIKLLPASANDLVRHVQCSLIASLGDQHKLTVLNMIDSKIMLEREKQGLPPMSDPLPGDPPNLFLTIRKIITGV